MSWNDRATFRRLMGLEPSASLKEAQEVSSSIAVKAVEEHRELVSGEATKYSSWTLPRLSEEEEFSLERLKSRRLMSMFEHSGMGGTLLPDLLEVTEAVLAEAGKSAIHADIAKHHIKAIQATKVAGGERHASSEVAYAAHKNASQLHRNAAHLMRQAGDHETALHHDRMAMDHDTHAHHAVLAGMDKAAAVKRSNAPTVHSPEVPPKTHTPDTKADTVAATRAEPHAQKKAAAHAPDTQRSPSDTMHSPTDTKRAPATAHSPSDTQHSPKAPQVKKSKKVDKSALGDKHKHITGMMRKHIEDLANHLHAGDHEAAQRSFNMAVHHAGNAKKFRATMKSAA